MSKMTGNLKCEASRIVVCINFKDTDNLHMIVDNLDFAKLYCKKYPKYVWEHWGIQHKTKESKIDFWQDTCKKLFTTCKSLVFFRWECHTNMKECKTRICECSFTYNRKNHLITAGRRGGTQMIFKPHIFGKLFEIIKHGAKRNWIFVFHKKICI